jgi:hypothetical protein
MLSHTTTHTSAVVGPQSDVLFILTLNLSPAANVFDPFPNTEYLYWSPVVSSVTQAPLIRAPFLKTLKETHPELRAALEAKDMATIDPARGITTSVTPGDTSIGT